MKKGTWAKLVIAILVVGGIAVGICLQWLGRGRASAAAQWGAGRLGGAEKSYFNNRAKRILDEWGHTRRTAERGPDGRFGDSYRTYLVIDTQAGAMWLEDHGRILPCQHVEFPAGMTWKLYYTTPKSRGELPGVTRLKQRGYNTNQHLTEQFYLVWSGRGAGHIEMGFSVSSRSFGSGGGRFTIPAYSSSRAVPEDAYPSLIASEAEYRQSLSSADSPDADEPSGSTLESRLDKNMAAWFGAEKLFYRKIEEHVAKAGFLIREIELQPGPDYSAGNVKLRISTEGVFRRMFRGGYWGDAFLLVDMVGENMWYLKSCRRPGWPANLPSNEPLSLEFLVTAGEVVSEAAGAELIEKGRSIQDSSQAAPPEKWKVELKNGATVKFLCLCENPSAGRKWWGPDGEPIEYIPYHNSQRYGPCGKNQKIYEIVWKIQFPEMPDGRSGGGTQISLEGSRCSYGHVACDRYGNRLPGQFQIGGYSFDNSREKTTLAVGVKVGSDAEYEQVEFRNISLVPNENRGFEIAMPDE
ncbi:MAG: hypothetical protein JW720_02195 [Sedimentisphaerales bacterium]|nr:hypothetical protein [Sedimentisphaerales bacterium]